MLQHHHQRAKAAATTAVEMVGAGGVQLSRNQADKLCYIG